MTEPESEAEPSAIRLHRPFPICEALLKYIAFLFDMVESYEESSRGRRRFNYGVRF
jgi:hypothetical protein